MSEEEKSLIGKISQFFRGIGRRIKKTITRKATSIKISIVNVATNISIKYLNLGTAYFNKKAKHLQNLKDREEFGRPMLRDFPKYVGIGIYEGFAALFSSVGGSLSDWKLARQLAEIKKESQD